MKGNLVWSGVAIALSLAVAPATAHHSFAAEFDENKPVKVEGVVTSMRWSNPHGWLYLDARNPDGTVAHWSFELGGLNGLYRQGWRKADLVAGTDVIVDGFLSRTDPHVGNSQSVTLADGRKLFAGSPPPRGEK